MAPILCPSLFFFPDPRLNHWHENNGLSETLGYCLLLLGISVVILMAAKVKFEFALEEPAPHRHVASG